MTEADEENKPEAQKEPGPERAGWQSLAKIFDKKEPVFEKTLFLEGYDFSCNIYILVGENLTIVDSGNDYTAFMQLFDMEFKPADIKKVVITHGHRDHAMGVFELLREYPSIIASGGFEMILHEASPPELKEVVKECGCRVTEVRGGETLELSGLEWEVIYTPGHTIDGICLYHAPTKMAFTGDMVLPDAMAEIDKNAGGRLDHYLYGVKSLLKRDIENVLPGHGIPVASIGRRVVEETYEAVMMRIIGVETKTPWIEGAMALAEKGLLEEAVFCCDKELAHNPEGLRALQLKALCLTDLERCEEAVELLDKILAQQGNNLYALIGKGHALLGLGKYNESLKYFDDALGINPDIKEAQIYKGMALYLSGRHEEAIDIEAFRKEFAEKVSEKVKEETLKKTQQANQAETQQSS